MPALQSQAVSADITGEKNSDRSWSGSLGDFPMCFLSNSRRDSGTGDPLVEREPYKIPLANHGEGKEKLRPG